MQLVSSTTVGAGGAATITFSGIPQTGTDILLTLSGRVGSGNQAFDAYLQLNGATTAYSERRLLGDGGLGSGDTNTLFFFRTNGGGTLANTFGIAQFYIPNYAGAASKTVSCDFATENNTTFASIGAAAMNWANTAAITSLTLNADGQLWSQGTLASLYIITKGSGGATTATA